MFSAGRRRFLKMFKLVLAVYAIGCGSPSVFGQTETGKQPKKEKKPKKGKKLKGTSNNAGSTRDGN